MYNMYHDANMMNIQELRKWIPVDQYGKCSANECDDTCYGNLGAQYKFYLSFENSLCKDYITEKFWNALGIIFKLLN